MAQVPELSDMRYLFIFVSLLIVAGCSNAPIAHDTAISDSALQHLVGKTVTLHGQLELAGKVGPYIHRNGAPVYLVPSSSFNWGSDYERMQGKAVSITGVLRFRHFENAGTSGMVDQPSDYFYLDAETAKVRLE